MIGAVAAFIFGLALTVFPTTMLAGFGLAVPDAAVVLSRDVGVTLIGLVVVQALELVVNAGEIAVGVLPVQAAGGLVIHLVLGAIFVLAMTRAR
jgi:hypothetical protein